MRKGLGITLAVVAVLLLAVLMVFGSYVSAKEPDGVPRIRW
jgi:hypothetical protein